MYLPACGSGRPVGGGCHQAEWAAGGAPNPYPREQQKEVFPVPVRSGIAVVRVDLAVARDSVVVDRKAVAGHDVIHQGGRALVELDGEGCRIVADVGVLDADRVHIIARRVESDVRLPHHLCNGAVAVHQIVC